MKKLEKIFAYVVLAALFCCFAGFALLSPNADNLTIVCGAFCALILAAAFLRGLAPFIKYWAQTLPAPLYEELGERSRRRLFPTVRLILLSLTAQIVFILVIYAIYNAVNGFSGTIFRQYSEIFMNKNAFGSGEFAHEAGRELALLPIVPLLADLLGSLTGRYALCAFLLNTACVSALTVVLYRVMLLDFDRRTALVALPMMYISPLMIYMLMPMSGVAPFVLFSLCAMYYMRRGRPLAAGIFCIPALCTSVFGILLLVPLAMCAVKKLTDVRSSGDSITLRTLCESVSALLLPLLAIGIIRAINALSIYNTTAPGRLFSTGFRFCFEDLGLLVRGWNSSPAAANAMFMAITALIGFGLMMGLIGKRMHSPFTVFTMFWYALVPAALGSSALSTAAALVPSVLNNAARTAAMLDTSILGASSVLTSSLNSAVPGGMMHIYALCLCPTLPIMTAGCLNKRLPRLILMTLLLAAQIVFTAVIFVKR